MYRYRIIILLLFLAWPAIMYAEDLPNTQWLGCYDGDTCSINVLLPPVLGTNIEVRMSGIDAPEIKGKCDAEKTLALAARDFLIAQLKVAKSITIEHVFRDKYFRIEGIIFADGINLNQLMLAQGYAVPYTGSGPRHDWCAP